ncbi:hypothetical protein GE061_007886 [Apolygus lucorum]|uniref:EGF-like domain-containing protein n=1 Tax=Apolygus lucorum TaxID=248454 RepID=A0A8S9WPM7_APOLU|nr:hypothetical protein GE061_007886 [Apolygus lucorum]
MWVRVDLILKALVSQTMNLTVLKLLVLCWCSSVLKRRSTATSGVLFFGVIFLEISTGMQTDGLVLPKNLEGKQFNLQGTSQFCECKNGGTCLYSTRRPSGSVQRINTGSCYCSELSEGIFVATGRFCKTLKNFCSPNPCERGGRCVNKMGYFFCVGCESGWSGHNCSKIRTADKQWAEDVTVVWYPNSDFQVTSISWLRVSFAQPGTQPLLIYLEYFGILVPIREAFTHESITPRVKECFEMKSEDVACNTYRKGIQYYTAVLEAQNHYLAAPYNLIFGADLEHVLTISHPEWMYRMYAVKYEVKLHVYNNKELSMPVTSLHLWHQVTSTYSACLPLISFDGCSIDAKYPWKWLAHDLVRIKLTARRQNNPICKNLVVELRDAITFFYSGIHDRSNLASRPPSIEVTRSNLKWQNNEEMSFEQGEQALFGFNNFWIATFPLRLYGSYLSAVGRDLYMELNAMCFLHTEPPRTIVTVEGGDRIVDCRGPVEFQPLSSNPLFDVNLFILRWSWTDDLGQTVLERHSRWGPQTFRRLICNREYTLKLEPFHSYYEMISGSNAGEPYVWTIKSEVASTEIQILCRHKCDKVNTMDEVLVEAVETPLSGYGSPEWTLYEGGTNGTILPLMEYKSTTGNPWLISIKRNALKAGTMYTIEALTTKGKGSKRFVTNSPPEKGICKINPEQGIKGVTLFNVTCKNWKDEDLPLLYTFGTNWNDLFEPLVESFYEDHLPSTVLFHDNISVCVTDAFKLKTDFPLKVKLMNNDQIYDFHREMNSFTRASLDRDYLGMKNWVVRNAEAAFASPNFPTLWKVNIFTHLLDTIPRVQYYYSVNQMVWSMLRLLKRNVAFAEDGVQDLMIGVGQGLENAAERLKHLCSMDAEFKSMWEPQIHGAVS